MKMFMRHVKNTWVGDGSLKCNFHWPHSLLVQFSTITSFTHPILLPILLSSSSSSYSPPTSLPLQIYHIIQSSFSTASPVSFPFSSSSFILRTSSSSILILVFIILCYLLKSGESKAKNQKVKKEVLKYISICKNISVS